MTWELMYLQLMVKETYFSPGFFYDMMEWKVGGELGGGFGGLVTRCWSGTAHRSTGWTPARWNKWPRTFLPHTIEGYIHAQENTCTFTHKMFIFSARPHFHTHSYSVGAPESVISNQSYLFNYGIRIYHHFLDKIIYQLVGILIKIENIC